MHAYTSSEDLTVALLAALQIHPRGSWTEIAPVLGVDASTLSRRWQHLQDEGLAWVTCQPSSVHDWYFIPDPVIDRLLGGS